jgi:hypothetical protein
MLLAKGQVNGGDYRSYCGLHVSEPKNLFLQNSVSRRAIFDCCITRHGTQNHVDNVVVKSVSKPKVKDAPKNQRVDSRPNGCGLY